MTAPPSPSPTRKRGFRHYIKAGLLLVDTESVFRGRHCWIWLGGQTAGGYGAITRRVAGKTKHHTAQRYFWLLYRGEPGKSLEVSHECHRRLCVNPYHMRLDTKQGNIGDWKKDYKLTRQQQDQISAMMLAGYPTSYVADKFMLPRLVVRRTVRELDWRNQVSIFDFIDDNLSDLPF